MVKAYYQYQNEDHVMVNYEKDLRAYVEAGEIIDHYPWEHESTALELTGEGGGLYFFRGDENAQHSSVQLIPYDEEKCFVVFEVVLKKGFLGFIGRKAVDKSFDEMPIDEAKGHVKKLFDYSFDALYDHYKNAKT